MPSVLELSVRELAEFVLRTGDLGGGGFSSPQRALAGTRLHQKIQKSRPDSYQKEVRLEKRLQVDGIDLLLRGRIDGLIYESGRLWLEEIKTVQSSWPPQPDPVHWGQAKIYAALYAELTPYTSATIQLTYAHLHLGEVQEFSEEHSLSDLETFFQTVLSAYLRWIKEFEAWSLVRDASIQSVTFPHGSYRPGQRDLTVRIYNSIRKEKRLFVNAPTGTGKTISALFPSLKAIGQGLVSKIFYLTSITLGRQVAEKALKDLRTQGLQIRSVTITAKSKICFNVQEGHCDVTTCPYAIGYHDRSHAAIRALLEREDISRPNIEAVAQIHQVCPFELSLDTALWSDVIIGDYNYLFDPSVSLKRFFQDEPRPYVFLIDEAHHLAERCRQMFSASLRLNDFVRIKKSSSHTSPACLRSAKAVAAELKLLSRDSPENEPTATEISDIPEKLPNLLLRFTKNVETFLAEENPDLHDRVLLELYFETLTFLRTLDELDSHYRVWKEENGSDLRLVLDCVDPAARIDRVLKQGRASIFISATLLPLEYFTRLLGARPEDPSLSLGSPFDPSNLGVFIADRVAADFKSRASSYHEVAEMIHCCLLSKKGNYLAFFPSYQYLRAVAAELEKLPASFHLLVQSPEMTEAERESFLAGFQLNRDSSLLGLAVMGGIFGEAIDLVGERLIGTIIVSVGLPQICFERSLTQELFSQQQVSGFDHAYTFPGYNRVLQAVGRVIRSETDQGIAILIDRRFAENRYRKMMPPWWKTRRVGNATELARKLGDFWARPDPVRGDSP